VPPADYDQFSISIPKESVVQGGVRIADVLADVPEEVEVRMRESEAAGDGAQGAVPLAAARRSRTPAWTSSTSPWRARCGGYGGGCRRSRRATRTPSTRCCEVGLLARLRRYILGFEVGWLVLT